MGKEEFEEIKKSYISQVLNNLIGVMHGGSMDCENDLEQSLNILNNLVSLEHLLVQGPQKKESVLKSGLSDKKTPIEELKLTLRVSSSLKRDGIFYIEELLKKTEDDLLGARGIGKRALTEIRNSLDKRGLSLKPPFVAGY